MKTFKQFIKEIRLHESEYRASHLAPSPEKGAPAHNLSSVYPEEFYSKQGADFYGDGSPDDKKVHSILKSTRNKPNTLLTVYRAVPNKPDITDINKGDWVGLTKNYANDHGELVHGEGNYKVLSKQVKASELFTDGNSYHKFGYHPQPNGKLTESTDHPMIDVDGVMKHRNNSLSQPIHPTDEGIRNFHRWFGDSDTVDEHGRPQVMYHATPALDRQQTPESKMPFDKFTKTNSGGYSFAETEKFARNYAQDKSFAQQSDLTPYTFSTHLKTKTFDPTNQQHINAIKPFLPDTINHVGKYGFASWGTEKKIPKEDFLEKLQGIHDVYRPLSKQMHDDAVVGKNMKFEGSSIFVLHKTPTQLYHTPTWHLDGLHPEHIEELKSIAKTEPDTVVEKKFSVKSPHARAWEPPKKISAKIYSSTYVPAKEIGDNWEYTENDTLKDALTKAGFNAIKQREGKSINTMVFNPNQIKSATGNNGDFHPDKDKITESK